MLKTSEVFDLLKRLDRFLLRRSCRHALDRLYPDAPLGTQRHLQFGCDILLPRGQLKMETLQEGGHDQGDLHHGEGVTDANVWPGPEGEIRIFGDVLHPTRSESVGVETLRLR